MPPFSPRHPLPLSSYSFFWSSQVSFSLSISSSSSSPHISTSPFLHSSSPEALGYPEEGCLRTVAFSPLPSSLPFVCKNMRWRKVHEGVAVEECLSLLSMLSRSTTLQTVLKAPSPLCSLLPCRSLLMGCFCTYMDRPNAFSGCLLSTDWFSPLPPLPPSRNSDDDDDGGGGGGALSPTPVSLRPPPRPVLYEYYLSFQLPNTPLPPSSESGEWRGGEASRRELTLCMVMVKASPTSLGLVQRGGRRKTLVGFLEMSAFPPYTTSLWIHRSNDTKAN